LKFQLAKRADRPIDAQPEFTLVGEDKVIASTRWTAPGTERETFAVLTLRDGKITDMQGCRTRKEAERFARR
jgi:hypothetical protein